MNPKFRGKYRIESARLKDWDYRNAGAYFITICTKKRIHYFGAVVNGVMHLNDIGKLAEKYWAEIPEHFPVVALGNFVVMPNHVHGILIIRLPVETLHCNVSTGNVSTQCNVSTGNPPANSEPGITNEPHPMSQISPLPGSISTIIRSYKSIVSKMVHQQFDPSFGWQSRFHDHIIRDERSYHAIDFYIESNPADWPGNFFFCGGHQK